MGIFFTKEDKGKYFLIRRRKYALPFAFLPAICFLLVGPLIYNISGTNLSAGIVALVLLIGIWMASEGAYYHDYLLKKYKKEGKRIERVFDTKIGTKVYK